MKKSQVDISDVIRIPCYFYYKFYYLHIKHVLIIHILLNDKVEFLSCGYLLITEVFSSITQNRNGENTDIYMLCLWERA